MFLSSMLPASIPLHYLKYKIAGLYFLLTPIKTNRENASDFRRALFSASDFRRTLFSTI